MTLFDIHTWGDVRAFIHSAAPGLAVLLVGVGALSGELAPLIVAIVLAVSDAGLSRVNTVDGFRKWLYPVLGALSALGIFLGIVTQQQISLWLSVIPILIGGGVAAANTNTSAV